MAQLQVTQGTALTECTRSLTALGIAIFLTIVLVASNQTGNNSQGKASQQVRATTNHDLRGGLRLANGCDPGATRWCSYGSLSGYWVSMMHPGISRHWKAMDAECQLKDLLSQYTVNKSTADDNDLQAAVVPPANQVDANQQPEGSDAATPSNPAMESVANRSLSMELPPALANSGDHASFKGAKIMFLSDSVDRHILTYLCELAGGEVNVVHRNGTTAKFSPVVMPAPASVPGGSGGSSSSSSSSSGDIPRYLPFICMGVPGLKLAAIYIPGVHPTGPYHKGLRNNYEKQIDMAVRMWSEYSTGDPDIVVVSSTLWDLARMAFHEPHLTSEPELSVSLIETWIANYTNVAQYALQKLPQAAMLVYHTTMAPKFDPLTGMFERAYLGRRFYVTQLNAAGRHAAAQLRMEVVDYAAIANRFLEGQRYLLDMIHPNKQVGLEVANVYLNYVQQIHAIREDNPQWQHCSVAMLQGPESSARAKQRALAGEYHQGSHTPESQVLREGASSSALRQRQ